MWHLFVIHTSNRDNLQKHLIKKRIQTLIHYPIAPHKQLAYKTWNEWRFPITEKIYEEILRLPISPFMSCEEVKLVVEKIKEYK